MMLAAAACAEGKGAPPPELELAWQCDRWHVLPHDGGLVDQPAGLLRRMSTLSSVYQTMRSWHERKAGSEAQWKDEHPRGWELMRHIEQLRRAHG